MRLQFRRVPELQGRELPRSRGGLKIIEKGSCGKVNLFGMKCAAILDWPRAIHQGNGKCVFVVEPTAKDKQIEALGQIFTGKLGGMPWELLGPTFEAAGLVKWKISIEGKGLKIRDSKPKASPRRAAIRSRTRLRAKSTS